MSAVASAQLTPIQGIRRELQRSLRSYVTGERDRPADATPATDSWFGPNSITWIVHSDASMFIGGIESLIVQTLHPPTMAGVADHSRYKSDALGRLHRTANFLGTTTFGPAADAERMVKNVRRIHNRITGTTPDGQPYEANDPHNLAWVHCTEVDGFLRAFRRYGRVTITDAEADQYVAEMARVGEALGVINAPQTVAELDDRLASYGPELQLGKQAREALRWLVAPPFGATAQGPYTILLSAAVNLLPGWARRKLWLPPSIPFVSDAMVSPAAKTLTSTLGWIMEPAPAIAEAVALRRTS